MTALFDFEGYSTGNLTGQGTWSGATAFQVQTTIKNSGSNAVKWPASSATHLIAASFAGIPTGVITAYMRMSSATPDDYCEFQIQDVGGGNTDVAGNIIFDTDGNIKLQYAANALVILGAYSANTWYKCDIEFRVSDGNVRARVNDGTWSDWKSPRNAWTTAITNIRLIGYGNADWYIDDISYSTGIIVNTTNFFAVLLLVIAFFS